jgi:hypothetical protein
MYLSFLFFLVTNCKFLMAWHDKTTHHDLNLLLLFMFGLDFLTKYFEYIHPYNTCFLYHIIYT